VSSVGELYEAAWRDFTRAFRYEARQVYSMPKEQPSITRFLAGLEKPEDHNAVWHERVRRYVASGRSIQRAKVVRHPLTDYLRYQFAWSVPGNVAAGEDYRIVDVTNRTVDLPEQDFWMFDESLVFVLSYDSTGAHIGREMVGLGDVAKYVRWRDIALKEAVPFGVYRA
jgi:hypothetical protein